MALPHLRSTSPRFCGTGDARAAAHRSFSSFRLLLFCTLSLGGAEAFAQSHDGEPAEASETQAPRRAIAVLQPTQGNNVRGIITFEETSEGVRMQANVSGLPGKEHAYHVHVYGDCSSADGSAAGPHYTFGPNDTGITGDLGELRPQGGGATEAKLIPLASLRGPNAIIGRSVVVHEKGNDPSQPPDGAAGARLACGVIGLDQSESAPRAGAQGSAGASEGAVR